MNNYTKTISDLIAICNDSQNVEGILILQYFLIQNSNSKVNVKNFEFEREKMIWSRRLFSLKNAGRQAIGLENLVRTLDIIDASTPLETIWLDVSGYINFIVVNLDAKNIIGFMILKNRDDIAQRKAAFRPDGSYDNY